MVYLAVRRHHDVTSLHDAAIPAEVCSLVAMGCIAEHLVNRHEGVREKKEWALHGPECLAYLQVNELEVTAWEDALHPVFEGVVLA